MSIKKYALSLLFFTLSTYPKAVQDDAMRTALTTPTGYMGGGFGQIPEQVARIGSKMILIGYAVDIIKDQDGKFKDISNLDAQGMKDLVTKIALLAGVASMLELCFDGVPAAITKIPYGIAHSLERLTTGLLRLCGMPTPIDEARLTHNGIMFEDVINTITKQQAVGSVMLRNVRVAEEAEIMSEQEQQWAFYVDFAIHRLEHVNSYLVDSLRYYKAPEGKKSWLQSLSARFASDSTPDIVCTIEEINGNIGHMISLLKAATNQDDLDINHLKMLSGNTKTLFKELKVLVAGARKQEASPFGS